MIPPDVANRLRAVAPDQPAQTQPATPTRPLTDILSDLVPGQRVLAEIQAMLPNGAYRAMVAQREITLALPFSAKAGDALELEVVDNDGKLALAVVTHRGSPETGGKGGESVSATLSQTGKLIGNLLGGIDDQGKGAKPAPLNGNQPLLDKPPANAAELAPLLKEALTKSGMFYEAHQARWAEGKFPTEGLLQEPQGRLSGTLQPQAHPIADTKVLPGNVPSAEKTAAMTAQPTTSGTALDSLQKASPQTSIPPDLVPLVRHQLDALATQNYVWQGQAWPGQEIYWEIEADKNERRGAEEGPGQQWSTRLKLTLPSLGSIDAIMHLRPGGAIDISLVTTHDEGRKRLAAAGDGLRQQLEDAGLKLTSLAVQHGKTSG